MIGTAGGTRCGVGTVGLCGVVGELARELHGCRSLLEGTMSAGRSCANSPRLAHATRTVLAAVAIVERPKGAAGPDAPTGLIGCARRAAVFRVTTGFVECAGGWAGQVRAVHGALVHRTQHVGRYLPTCSTACMQGQKTGEAS